MKEKIREAVLDLVFPADRCLACGDYLDSEGILCPACQRDYVICKDDRICDRCGRPLSDHEMVCEDCLGEDRSVQNRALLIYTGGVRRNVIAMKFFSDRTLCWAYGRELGRSFAREVEDCDLLIPMPLSEEGLKERGYNQTEVMARGMLTGKDVKKLRPGILLRSKHTAQQAKLTSRAARVQNVKNAFFVPDPKAVQGKKILLLDDIFTTGATMEAARGALLKAGGLQVRCITLCVRVPRSMRKSAPADANYRVKTINLSKTLKIIGRKINKNA